MNNLNASAKYIFCAKTQMATSAAKSGADRIELLNVLNKHSHLTKMTLVNPTQE